MNRDRSSRQALRLAFLLLLALTVAGFLDRGEVDDLEENEA